MNKYQFNYENNGKIFGNYGRLLFEFDKNI